MLQSTPLFSNKDLTFKLIHEGRCTLRGVNVGSVISNMIDTVLDNFATGIGRILSIKHVKDLQSSTKPPSIPTRCCVFLFQLLRVNDFQENLVQMQDYANWYHREVKGKQLCLKILGKIIYAAIKL